MKKCIQYLVLENTKQNALTSFTFPLSLGCRFSSIGPIYYEYGSMVVTFDSSTSAVQAFEFLKKSAYEEKNLLGKQNFAKNILECKIDEILSFFTRSDAATHRKAVHASSNSMSSLGLRQRKKWWGPRPSTNKQL